MANEKKFNVVSIVILAVLALALIMGIVGICIDWLGVSVAGETDGAKFKDLLDLNKMAKDAGVDPVYPGIEAAQAFGIIAIIAAGLTAVSYAVSKFVDIKALKFVTIGLAAVLIICSLLALILTFTCTSSEYCKQMKERLDATFMPAAGCWLLSIFGVVGGAAGVYGGLKG